MKYIILFAWCLTFICIGYSNASPPPQWTPWPLTGRIYLQQSSCPAPCYSLVENGVLLSNLEVLDLKDVEIDDGTKPIYSAPRNVQACASAPICRELIRDKCPVEIPDCQASEYLRYCEAPDAAYFKVVGNAFEAYCTHRTGYEKKTVKKLMVDSVKLATYNQAQAEAAAEKAAKATKESNRESLLIACAKLDNSATAAQVRNCTILLAREVMKQKLKSDEM